MFTNTEMDTRLRVMVVDVGVDAFTTTPMKASLSIKRPLCQCLPFLTRSRKVGTFYFGENTMTSLAANIDLTDLGEKKLASIIRVKVKVQLKEGEKIVAGCDLTSLLDDLTQQQYVDLWREGKVVLRLVTEDYGLTREEKKEDSVHHDTTEGQMTTQALHTDTRRKRLRKRKRKARKQTTDETTLSVETNKKEKTEKRKKKAKKQTADDITHSDDTKKEEKAVSVQKQGKHKTRKKKKKQDKAETVTTKDEVKAVPVQNDVTKADVAKTKAKKKVQKKQHVPPQSVTWTTINVPPECRSCTLNAIRQLHLLERYTGVRISVPPLSAPYQCPVVIRGPLGDVRVVRALLVSSLGITERRPKQQRRQQKGRPKPQTLPLGSIVEAAEQKGNTDKERLKKARRRLTRRDDNNNNGKGCG